MDAGSTECQCHRGVRVFHTNGGMYCVRCLGIRAPRPVENHSSTVKGVPPVLRKYWEPSSSPGWEEVDHGTCWLQAIFPIARATSGNYSFGARLQTVANRLYQDGCLSAAALRELQVYSRGMNWFRCYGPVPGVALYANSGHVSESFFTGATAVLTNLPLFQEKVPCPFLTASQYQIMEVTEGDQTFYVYASCNEYFWGKVKVFEPNTTFSPETLKYLKHLPKVLPAGCPCDLNWLMDTAMVLPGDNACSPSPGYAIRTFAFEDTPEDIGLYLKENSCWTVIFPETTRARLLHEAQVFGYQLKWGVPSKWLNRKVHQEGLRLVHSPEGRYKISALHSGSWIMHVRDTLSDDGDYDYPVVFAQFDVISSADITPEQKIFRFNSYGYVGGRLKRKTKRSPPPDSSDSWSTCSDETVGSESEDKEPPPPQPNEKEAPRVEVKHFTPVPIGDKLYGRPMTRTKKCYPVKPRRSRLEVYNPPGDGWCGLHCLDAVIKDLSGFGLKSKIAMPPLDSSRWVSNQDLELLIHIMQLPVTIKNGPVACRSAAYVITYDKGHWYLTATKEPPRQLSPLCISGCCTGACRGGSAVPVLCQNIMDMVAYHYNASFDEAVGWLLKELGMKIIPDTGAMAPRTLLLSDGQSSKKPEQKSASTPADKRDECSVAALPRLDVAPTNNQDATVATPATQNLGDPQDTGGGDHETAGASSAADMTTGKDREAPTSVLLDCKQRVEEASAHAMRAAVGRVKVVSQALPPVLQQVFRWIPQLPSIHASSFMGALDYHHPTFIPGCLASILLGCLSFANLFFALFFVPLIYLCRANVRCFIVIAAAFLCASFATMVEFTRVVSSCEDNGDDCRVLLSSYIDYYQYSPPRTPTLGLLGVTMSALAAGIGGSRNVWLLLLRLCIVADVGVILACILFKDRCRHCFGKCIRTVRGEVHCHTFPTTKVAATTLQTLCDTLPKGTVDIVYMLTGVRGCYRGNRPPAMGKPTPYSKIELSKVGPGTLIPPPCNAAQAATCIKAVLAGASIVSEQVVVTKATTVPFRSAFFPNLRVCADQPIIVDIDTYMAVNAETAWKHADKMVVGQGDFAAVNQIIPNNTVQWPNRVITQARAGIKGLNVTSLINQGYVKAGYAIPTLVVACYVLFNLVVGAWVQASHSCGVGTSDPFCVNPFSQPVLMNQGMCSDGYCLSSAGLSVASPMLAVDYFPIAALLAAVCLLAGVMFSGCLRWGDVTLGACMVACLVYPMCGWLSLLTPFFLWQSVSYTMLGCYFLQLLFLSPFHAAVIAFVVLFFFCVRYIPVPIPSLVLPSDIMYHTKTPLGAAALASAKPGTYLHAVKQCALTGRVAVFVPTNTGITLEGAFRSSSPTFNTCKVFGQSSGTGSIWERDGKHYLVTATHVCSELNGKHEVEAVIQGQRITVQMQVKGDYAEGLITETGVIKGCFWPKMESVRNYEGRAYWYTSSGVEPGIVLVGAAICFTTPGDSGSAVVSSTGQFIGVHTGSNQNGYGCVTRFDGTPVVGQARLSRVAGYFDGDLVPTPEKLPVNIIRDANQVPSTLAKILTGNLQTEGALGPIQLTVTLMVFLKCAHFWWAAPAMIGFFLLNEVLPRIVVRCAFSWVLSVLAMFTPLSYHVVGLRLFSAALNRNKAALLFFTIGAVSSLLFEWPHPWTATFLFTTRDALPAEKMLLVITTVHAVGFILSLLGVRGLSYVLNCEGTFNRAFFARYFLEGDEEGAEDVSPIQSGVSKSIGVKTESLTAALAAKFSQADLDFLQSLSGAKAFKSASNLRGAATNFAEVTFAKGLRLALSDVKQTEKSKDVMAKLEDFLCDVDTTVRPGDLVILLGKTEEGEILTYGEYNLVCVDVRHVAGSIVTVCMVVDPAALKLEGVDVSFFKKNGRSYLMQRGKALADCPLESMPLKSKRSLKKLQKANEELAMAAKVYKDFRQGNASAEDAYQAAIAYCDAYYRAYGVAPEGGEDHQKLPSPLSVDEALVRMGLDKKLTNKEVERLRMLVSQLKDVISANEALNLMSSSGGTGSGRRSICFMDKAAKIVDYHRCTRFFDNYNLKVVDFDEARELVTVPTNALIYTGQNWSVFLRHNPPSLIDRLYYPHVITRGPPVASPGDTGVDGTTWDESDAPTPEALELTRQISAAGSNFQGDNYLLTQYACSCVNGDPYRKCGVLYNTRFGNIKYTTFEESGHPLHKVACVVAGKALCTDGKFVLGSVVQGSSELYIPTVPKSVLNYLGSRSDTPEYYTRHGTEGAVLEDLNKYDLSTQGFILPMVLDLVREYLLRHVGRQPPIYTCANIPSNDSCAGVNGRRFTTKMVQSIPGIERICARAVREVWQTVTPCTPKKQYCSKPKTRTILGTNNAAALPLRALLSGVTQAFMKAGKKSPILLGKNKFQPLQEPIRGLCLEADLASCDRSTPAIVRWFCVNLLFELAGAEDAIPFYVVNCAHDLVATSTTCFTKRGGLSSGDPVTSISNTIYSLVLYTQHMFLSALKNGHPIGLGMLKKQVKMEDLLELQPLVVYSDDLVLHGEKPSFPNYKYWNDHLSLALGFPTDPGKIVIGYSPSFLGCRVMGDGYQLVPLRNRILASLSYHMGSKNAGEYYASAASILMDACACLKYDTAWYAELISGIRACAEQDGYTFPGEYFFDLVLQKVCTAPEKKELLCAICSSPTKTRASCTLALCDYHAYYHTHCPVNSPVCPHVIGSGMCCNCKVAPMSDPTPMREVFEKTPWARPSPIVCTVVDGVVTSQTPIGRYQSAVHGRVYVKKDILLVTNLPTGKHTIVPVKTDYESINWCRVERNLALSKIHNGPPGCGKSHLLKQMITDRDTVFVPTHQTMHDMVRALGQCRFTIPDSTLEFPEPSKTGPLVRVLSSGYTPSRVVYVDEIYYCNPMDLLKLLSHTPVVGFGDPNQLCPVGWDSHWRMLDAVPRESIHVSYRFGPRIGELLSPFYDYPIKCLGPPTKVFFQQDFKPIGLVVTPYHADRSDGIITIDSSQGLTVDECTIYLPTKGGLTVRRFIVAASRARVALYIYDPHDQLGKLGISLESVKDVHYRVVHDPTTICGLAMEVVCDGRVLSTISYRAKADRRVVLAKDLPSDLYLKAFKDHGSFELESTSYQLSCLPQVAHNLGFYYSPDLPKFFPIPEKLCPFWPVVTNHNNKDWPNRLVISLGPLEKTSLAATTAGYYIGSSCYIGKPGVPSYYLTLYVDGAPEVVEGELWSTGRIELDDRAYLDQEEKDFATAHAHACLGEDVKSVIGGSHHITSQFLPPVMPRDTISVVGVSSAGKAAKAKCSVTDIYLPAFRPYLAPSTVSKVYKVNVDCSQRRLMVWRDATFYFQEAKSTHYALTQLVNMCQVPQKYVVHVQDSLMPYACNRIQSHDAELNVGPTYGSYRYHLSETWVEDVSAGLLLRGAFRVRREGSLYQDTALAFVYEDLGDSNWYHAENIDRLQRLSGSIKCTTDGVHYNFHTGPFALPFRW
nr:ORF1ab [Praja virus]